MLEIFLKFNENSIFFPITNLKMTRFSLSLNDAVNFVINCLIDSVGGEIFVPKIKSYKLIDLAKSINPQKKIKVVGLRPGEKIHEELITLADNPTTYDMGKYYVILPSKISENIYKIKYKKFNLIKKVNTKFSYNSFDNKNYLSIAQIKKQLKNFKYSHE